MIAWVDNHHHFVLVTGFDTSDSNIYYVNDPYYNRTYYNVTDVVGWIEYSFDFKREEEPSFVIKIWSKILQLLTTKN